MALLVITDVAVLGARLSDRLDGGGSVVWLKGGYTVEVTVNSRTGICA